MANSFSLAISTSCFIDGTKVIIIIKLETIPTADSIPNLRMSSISDVRLERKLRQVVMVARTKALPTK